MYRTYTQAYYFACCIVHTYWHVTYVHIPKTWTRSHHEMFVSIYLCPVVWAYQKKKCKIACRHTAGVYQLQDLNTPVTGLI